MTGAEVWTHIHVQGPSECWPWTKARAVRGGYGVARIGGKTVKIARWLIEQKRGPLAPGELVCHTCDNPPCCNPAHLYVGTHADNMRDAVDRGRINPAVGSRNFNTKLTVEQVRAARVAMEAGAPIKRLARTLGVDGKTLRRIRDRQTWRWVQ